ncbi:unnamed protein product [Diamesa serratosioi]
MERFAKILSGRRKVVNFDSICRCCGMVNDERCLILEQNDDDVPLKEKISDMIGIAVHRTDQMPQNICMMCMDKISDFYEFRLMVLNTEQQTRDALGLSMKPSAPIKKENSWNPSIPLFDDENLLVEVQSTTIKSGPASKKKKASPMPVALAPPPKKSKKDISCTICVDLHYSYLSDLTDHQIKDHLPSIARYACGSCRETFETLSEQKIHDSWHSKEKILYECFICSETYVKPKLYAKHMTNYSCPGKEKLEVLVTDIKCFQCRKKFITQSLFEWHGCFLKNKGNCSKCGKYYIKKKLLFAHYVTCDGKFVAPEDPDDILKVKIEKAEASKKATKARTVPMRVVKNKDIIKKELDLEEDDEYLNYEEDIMHDNDYEDSNHGVSDRSGASTPANVLEPQIELKEKVPPLRIKLEKINTGYGDSSREVQPTITIDPNVIRNIKKEKTLAVKTALTQQKKNLWQLKIKQEKGAVPSKTVLNPMALRKNNPDINHTEQKLYKIPQGLAMKIKREKMDSGYGDKSNCHVEERDEAEAEDEEFLNPDIVKIKKEKFDPDYQDKTVTGYKSNCHEEERDEAEAEDEEFLNPDIVKIKKEKFDPDYEDKTKAKSKPENMRINPFKIMREKRLAEGNLSSIDDRVNSPGASSSSSSQPLLIISHVTSIPNEIIQNHDKTETEESENTNSQSNADTVDEVQSKSKNIIKPTIKIKREMNNEDIRINTSHEEDSCSNVPGDILMEGTSMVEIPNNINTHVNEESDNINMEPESIEKSNQIENQPNVPAIVQIENQSNVPAVESDELENAVLNGFDNEFNLPVDVNDAELTLEELLKYD